MADYRLYLHDHAGHFRDVLTLECADDAEAIAAAAGQRPEVARELWRRDRKVRHFEAEGRKG